MIFTRDFVTRENYWQIASLVTQESLFMVTHALFFMYFINSLKDNMIENYCCEIMVTCIMIRVIN